MQSYHISKKAILDLEQIWLYTYNKWSLEQADRYHNLIINEIEFISKNFNLSRKIDYISPNYRMSKVKSQLIFYKQDSNNIIEVIRILHQRLDIKNNI